MNSPPAARGSQEAGFTQPRPHSFAQLCIGRACFLMIGKLPSSVTEEHEGHMSGSTRCLLAHIAAKHACPSIIISIIDFYMKIKSFCLHFRCLAGAATVPRPESTTMTVLRQKGAGCLHRPPVPLQSLVHAKLVKLVINVGLSVIAVVVVQPIVRTSLEPGRVVGVKNTRERSREPRTSRESARGVPA